MLRAFSLIVTIMSCAFAESLADDKASGTRSIAFEKRTLTDKYYCDGINTGDFNRDGKPDVVAGPYWYAGPELRERHEFYPAVVLPPERSPSNSMFSYVGDFNGDGWDDILVLGRVHLHEAYWYENPGSDNSQVNSGSETTDKLRLSVPPQKSVPPQRLWKKHFVFERIRGESPPFVDVDGDRRPELVCHWVERWGLLRPNWNEPTKPWQFEPITERGEFDQFYHGTGVGDVNGDGRLDLILNDGWWEQPERDAAATSKRDTGVAWTAHPFRFARRGGAQMFAYDVDGDGDNDIITALDGHGWGLAWFEQVRDGREITFREHKIMGDRSEEATYGVAFSQPHALDMADIDGDGLKDIVVGKRRWAHGPSGDVEPNATPVLYWFRLVRQPGKPVRFEPNLVDERSGVGVQLTVVDVNQDGKNDILTVSKLGTFVFLQRK
jgi:hypothetical protein